MMEVKYFVSYFDFLRGWISEAFGSNREAAERYCSALNSAGFGAIIERVEEV